MGAHKYKTKYGANTITQFDSLLNDSKRSWQIFLCLSDAQQDRLCFLMDEYTRTEVPYPEILELYIIGIKRQITSSNKLPRTPFISDNA